MIIQSMPPKQGKQQQQSSKQAKKQQEIQSMEECFRILYVDKHPEEIFVPSCVQFRMKDLTDVNFENLSARVNGVLCINFLIFTHNKHIENMLLERLYWNPEEQKILEKNRKKKVERKDNFMPVVFNKDIIVKLPTTRKLQYQIQAFKSRVYYEKQGKRIKGWRVFHVIRKEFRIEIIKSTLGAEFFAPYNFINTDMTVTLNHMNIGRFQYEQKINKERQQAYVKAINEAIHLKFRYQLEGDGLIIKRINFNNLRLEEPFRKAKILSEERLRLLAPMMTVSTLGKFGKYDIVETQMEALTYDERQIINLEEDKGREVVFQDGEPTQLSFKPFKYAIFKIPLFRQPVVDMMTIFVPLWLLAFISIYIFYQTAEIMNRILNVATLMIAYAAIQPIVRENIPDATNLTLVDVLIYTQLFVNILFLSRSINIRQLYDDATQTTDQTLTNQWYDRWQDGLFVASVVITIVNVLIVVILICRYLFKRDGYKGPRVQRMGFEISESQNWTLNLLMERAFARYNQSLLFLEDTFNTSTSKKHIEE